MLNFSTFLFRMKVMQRNQYEVPAGQEEALIKSLDKREDADAMRMKRYLSMPDLSRAPGNPIYEIVQRILNIPEMSNLDVIKNPEIVPADISFDLFDFPKDHPTRSKSDTYYTDDEHILRTHTTIMWYYYTELPEIKERIKKGESVGCFSYGKVYRKDEIDRHHMNVFHQIDGWFLCRKDEKIITTEDLQNVLIEIARAVFGKDVKYKFNEDTFPFTTPSLEMEIEKDDKWVEVLGSGVVKAKVLDNLGVDSNIYNGWAFGFGLERLALISMELPDIRLLWSEDARVKKQLKLGQKYKEVSKYPPVVRDISFVVGKDFVPNNYFDLIRETIGEDIVEEVKMIDKYENEAKIGKDKISYAYRIVYRSLEGTLTSTEVDTMHKKLEQKTAEAYEAKIR